MYISSRIFPSITFPEVEFTISAFIGAYCFKIIIIYRPKNLEGIVLKNQKISWEDSWEVCW